MMHDRFDSRVDLLLAGGLDDAERREAEAHAASCAPCGALLADARSFRAWATGAIAPDAPPADLEDRIVARFRATNVQTPRRSWPRLARAVKIVSGLVAAVLLIVVGAAFTATSGPAGTAGAGGITPLNWVEQGFRSQVGMDFRDVARAELLAQSGVQDSEARISKRTPKGIAELHDDTGSTRSGLMTSPTDAAAASFAVEDTRVDVMNRANQLALGATSSVHGDLYSLQKDLSGRIHGGELGDQFNKKDQAVDVDTDGIELGIPSGPTTIEPAKPEPVVVARPPKPEMEKADDLKLDPGSFSPKLAAAYDPEPIQAGRKLIRNGDVTVEVESYDAALVRINAIVAEEKGFVSSADTERMANGKISATVTLRIPPERFEAVVERFRALGTVRHQSITTQDVTKAYVDLESRLSSKQSLMDRLKKVLAEAKGTVKELMEVEVQMGKTLEDLEAIKGELKYFDNLVGLSTIILRLAEKDLGQPFEVVQTLQSAIGITSAETEAAYARAQKIVTDAGGQVIDSNLVRSKDGSARGTIKAKVDAEKFPALREELRKLGHVDVDTVVDRKTARGGQEGPARPDAPVRKEQALVTLSIVTPPIHVARTAQLSVETADVEGAYLMARKAVEAAGGKVLGGSVTGRTDGMSAVLTVQVETGKFVAVLDGFRGTGRVLHSTSSQAVPPAEGALVRERGEIALALSSPPVLIGEQHGLGKTVRDTFSGSVAGVMWSVEKLFVGLSLAGPWIAVGLGAWYVYRRIRRKRAAQPAA